MPSYIYRAKKDATSAITGQISASNEQDALETIHQLGLIPVSIEESSTDGVLISDIREVKIKTKELYLFSKQLGSMLKSGVPLLKALAVLSEQTDNAYLSRIFSEICFGVKSGRTFSSCLTDYPAVFSAMYVAMIKAGEEVGRLWQMLGSMADYLKAQDEFSSKVRSAMIYPAFMLIIGTCTVIFILTFVMPKMALIFKDAGQALPWPTRVVLSVSHWVQTSGLWAFCGLILAAGALGRFRSTLRGSIIAGQLVLNLPLVRDFVLKVDLARFTRTMALLLESGLPIVRAMELAVPTVHNPQLKRDLLLCIQDLTGGESMGKCLGRSALIAPMVVQLIAVGEETGSLQGALRDIAESYEAEVNESTRAMTTVLEPAMILLVGTVVGFIVFAMLLPIFSMDIMAN